MNWKFCGCSGRQTFFCLQLLLTLRNSILYSHISTYYSFYSCLAWFVCLWTVSNLKIFSVVKSTFMWFYIWKSSLNMVCTDSNKRRMVYWKGAILQFQMLKRLSCKNVIFIVIKKLCFSYCSNPRNVLGIGRISVTTWLFVLKSTFSCKYFEYNSFMISLFYLPHVGKTARKVDH